MYATDFVFDNRQASDLGYMICHIVTENSMSISMGSEIEFETVTGNKTNTEMIIRGKYSNPISITFDIAKLDCENVDTEEFSPEEIEYVMKWLNRKERKRFKVIYEKDEFINIYYLGTFTTIQLIYVGGKVIGMTLTFTSDSPYGHTDMYFSNSLQSNDTFNIFVESSEIGYIYPNLKITVKESGDLKLKSEKGDFETIIKNCTVDEVITLDSAHEIIHSSNHPGLYNDFNYEWVRLESQLYDNNNEISTTLACDIDMEYSCPRKVGIIL